MIPEISDDYPVDFLPSELFGVSMNAENCENEGYRQLKELKDNWTFMSLCGKIMYKCGCLTLENNE